MYSAMTASSNNILDTKVKGERTDWVIINVKIKKFRFTNSQPAS